MIQLPTDPELVARRKDHIYETAPLHPTGDLQPWQSTIVFAPHPDDESLGCGGLIATLTDRGQSVRVVFVSDGGMSHPNSKKYPRQRRVSVREQEAINACGLLGVTADKVHFLRLPDGEVPRQWHKDFPAIVTDLGERLTDWAADTLVVPWRRDPHPDHRASWEICRSAAESYSHDIRWVEYPVWMWEATNVVDLPRDDEMITWRLDITEQLDRKQRAIHAHASQYAGLIDDDPEGFQLQQGMLDHFRRPYEIFFEEAEKRQHSLGTPYFDEVYGKNDDPWQFETSDYEHTKYAATLDALPADRYASALEIGCSIGVLTELLAGRCDRLLAIDGSEAPLERAKQRLVGHSHVHFRRMVVPEKFPQETFDLIVLSEVGYYWSYADLDRTIASINEAVESGGTLLLVHYTPYVPDYPLTGDEVHEAFTQKLRGFYHVHGDRQERYRLDVWKKK